MLDGDNVALGLNAASPSIDQQGLIENRIRLEQQLKNASGWFFWIAGLSIINSVVMLSGSTFHFVIGLGITTLVDAVAYHNAVPAAQAAAFIVNLFIVGVPIVFGIFARKGKKWAFITGMVLYTFDGLILLAFRDLLGVAFHVYALVMIYRGIAAAGLLERIRQATLATTPMPIEP
jgi:hypothetical protein